ncbi:MAG: histidine kinase [Acidobacteria bacterium]|nr:histidine kinase [Acidobacteriota bacterium]
MSEAASRPRGKLKVFLGYAAGVGKTYRMLEEAHQLKREGRDIVVGYFEPHGRQDTIARIEGLEVVPRQRVEYRGHEFEEMDAGAVLARRPEICAVDELPHTNVPGSARGKRWEDVMALLDAGIDVLTTMNVQHLESLNDQMREITGIQVRETIPDWVVKQAGEVVLIDLPPRALLNRLQRGVVYGPDKTQSAMENFFKEPTLAALREMALRQTAHEVDVRQSEAADLDLLPRRLDRPPAGSGDPRERILIHVTESPAAAGLIRRGRRVADYLKAQCFAVCVLPSSEMAKLPKPAREAIERHLDFARKLHIETRVLEGKDAAEALVDFARRNGVTQIFLAKPPKRSIPFLNKKHFAMRVVDLAKDMQVTVVAERRHAS